MEEKGDRKKKKQFFKNQAKKKNAEPELLSGFIITCDSNKEKNAINDAYNVLNEVHLNPNLPLIIKFCLQFTEKLYPRLKQKEDVAPEKKVKTEDEKSEKSKSHLVCDLLEEELNKLKEKDEKYFYTHDLGIKKGVVFIKINPKFPEISPYLLCDAIMQEVHHKKKEISRFCHKLIPIEKCFPANFEAFKIHMKELIQKTFSEEEKMCWFLEFKSRNNSKFKQKEFLDFVIENVGKNHFVSYKEPKITLFVEINQATMSLAVLKNYFEYKKYSMHVQIAATQPKTNENKPEIKENNEEKPQEKTIENPEEEEEVRLI